MNDVLWDKDAVEAEMQRRLAAGEPLAETLTWLGKSGAKVAEAVRMLEQYAGLTHERAEHEVAVHPDWAPLVKLMGGMAGEEL